MNQDIQHMAADILQSDRFAKARRVRHHNEHCNIASHSLETTEHALRISRILERRGIMVNEEDVIRACLLHDIGMTEDGVFLSPSYRKAHSHPREGSRIARDEFGANDVQEDAIRHHMWPIGLIPPHSTEGWVIVAADKCCSLIEVQREIRDITRRVSGSLRKRTKPQSCDK